MKIIRLIIVLLLFIKIGHAQSPVVKLTYQQIITKKSTGEKLTKKVRGIMNSFQPILLSLVESSSDLKKFVFIEKNKVYMEHYLEGQEGIYSAKVEKKGKTYYLNKMTGEEKLFDKQNFAFSNIEFPTKFKLKNKRSKESEAFEIYQAENIDMLIAYHVNPQLKIKKNTNLSEEFLYDNKVITKRIIYIKKEDKQILNELISIDTLKGEVLQAYLKINGDKNSHLAKLKIPTDSINYYEEIPDIYINQIGNESTLSLNKYKGNGKYLMVDFWGTWCKPCLAAIPELKLFYEEYADKINLIGLNYNDPNETRVKEKIKEYDMVWDHGSVSEKVLKILNPSRHFPGILLFDDKMRLLVRDKSGPALKKIRNILSE